PLVIWPVLPTGALTAHEAAQTARYYSADLVGRFSRPELECLLNTLAELYDGHDQADLSERQQTLADRLRTYWYDAQAEEHTRSPAPPTRAFPQISSAAGTPLDAPPTGTPPTGRSTRRRTLP